MTQSTRPHLRGELPIPGDKSISHRALIFAALTQGTCEVEDLSPAEDVRSTARCLEKLGLQTKFSSFRSECTVVSPGLSGLSAPSEILDAGNSGTTIRLLSGLVAGQSFAATFDGDASLRGRPMGRVLKPLETMGASISYKERDNYPPFTIAGGNLAAQAFELPVASAQVQTAILLAGLQADGETVVKLPSTVRDHTTKFFSFMGVPFSHTDLSVSVKKLTKPAAPYSVQVPGDISSAAFFMVAAACLPGSDITLKNVGINPGRTLVIDILQEMGVEVTVIRKEHPTGEPVADIRVRYSERPLGTQIDGTTIATGIDEIPILALAGTVCAGIFTVRDAEELRVKESDRIAAIVANLKRAGAQITEHPDGMEITGQPRLAGGSNWETFGDHRLSMTGMIASIICEKPVIIDDVGCAAVSYPQFEKDLAKLLEHHRNHI
jgi:3-phosphoshikimate 1-carboxyvinyltransferase